MSFEVRRNVDDWWFVECDDCDYYAGPFDARDDAVIDGAEHDCPPDRTGDDA